MGIILRHYLPDIILRLYLPDIILRNYPTDIIPRAETLSPGPDIIPRYGNLVL